MNNKNGRLKISPNLALGFAELQFLQETISVKNILAELVKTFGVVRTTERFPSLQIYRENIGSFVSLRGGSALDKSFNLIKTAGLRNIFEVPNDGIERSITIKYQETTVERFKVNVQPDGLMTIAVPTTTVRLVDDSLDPDSLYRNFKLSDRLRGAGPFPTKVRFPNSTVNTGEYFVRSVIDDSTAILNVADGVLYEDIDTEIIVVGSYTPGAEIPSHLKEPFITGSLKLQMKENFTPSKYEFILATVKLEDDILIILDKRKTNLFEFSRYVVDHDEDSTYILNNP